MPTTMEQLPGPLRLMSSSPFVGRSRELATLRALLPLLPGEGRRIALIGGEAGSGKSRLVREFAREAAAHGAAVLYGACDAVVRTPYRPFVDALDQLVRGADPDELRESLGPAGGELTRLLPDLPARVEGLSEPVAADADTERHRLHSVVGELLSGAGRRRPILLVLEDGHWADTSTLHLLRHLARAAVDARMLVVATFRDTEADVPVDLAAALADLRRADDIVRLKLGGLSEDDIVEFARRASGADENPSLDELARAIHGLTAGNAFLVCELWRALLETGTLVLDAGLVEVTRPIDDVATPESVREVVSQAVARLDAATRDLLELAAVAGQDFELDILRRAAPVALTRPDALDAAVRSGMLEEVPGRTLAFGFTHELVRRAVYDRLTSLRRAELHLQVAEALEQGGPPRSGRVLADLAYHYAAAAPLGIHGRAIEYNLLAAQAAAAALAFGEAATHLSTALALGIDDDAARAEAHLALGMACFRGGASADALAAFREAAAIARSLGDGELLARAAIGFEDTCWRPGISDEGALELLEEASAAHAPDDSPLRVQLLAGVARALDYQGEQVRASIVRTSAIAMARRIDDRHGLATTLMRSYWSRGTTSLEEILAMLTEARDLAEAMGDLEQQAEAMEWRVAALMALGEIETAAGELDVVRELASRTRQPFTLHVAEHYGSALALLQGRFAEAEAAAQRSHDWSRLLTGRDASGVYGLQMFNIRREQGRLEELAPVVRILAGRSGDAAWRPGFAVLLAELGMADEARRELARVRGDGLEAFRATLWLGSLIYLADACGTVGDAETAALVYPELAPFAGVNVMVGHGVSLHGSADRYLGVLAVALGNRELAARHFEAALALDRRMGARTWLAHTAYEYGRLMLATGQPERAATLLGEAATLAEAIGMPALLSRVRALGTPASSDLPDALSAREAEVLRLVARGLSNREIGAELHISEHTAANHIRSILRKTRCANRTEAAAYAISRGLADRPTRA